MCPIKTKDNHNINLDIEGKGKTLLCLHGFLGSSDDFRILKRLLKDDFKIISYDQRGFGCFNYDEPLDIKILADDLCEVLKWIDEKVIVIGHSMGGSVILEYLKNYKDEFIDDCIFIESSPKMLNDEKYKDGLFKGTYTIKDLDRDLYLIENEWESFLSLFIDKLFLNKKREKEIALQKMKKIPNKIMSSLWKSLVLSDYLNDLKNIKKGVCVIRGEKSSFYTREAQKNFSNSFNKSSFGEIEDANHLIMLEKPRELSELIKKYIVANF
ncbi:MAG: alpha/beta hydrolase [Tissierellales bacterium]|nr:alpha/beta hydrolase [Tissierellales bacterium]